MREIVVWLWFLLGFGKHFFQDQEGKEDATHAHNWTGVVCSWQKAQAFSKVGKGKTAIWYLNEYLRCQLV